MPDAVAERRRRLACLVLVLAPLSMLIADACKFLRGDAAFWPWTILLWISMLLFVLVIASLVHLASRGSDRLGLVAGFLALVGAVTGATIQGIQRAQVVAIDRLGPDAKAVIEATYGEAPLLPTSIAPGLTFPIGLLLLSLALVRARVAPGWVAAAIAVGAVLFPVGRIGGFILASLASDTLLLVGLGTISLGLARGGPAAWTARRSD